MPTSPWKTISPILGLITNIQPQPSRILDIGFGTGKYGFLCREYLTFWLKTNPNQEINLQIDGIEAFEANVGELQRLIYDDIFTGDAYELIENGSIGEYDLTLLIDVIEHFDKATGLELIRKILTITDILIVSTPSQFWPQGDLYGNEYEIHKSLWTKSDLRNLGACYVNKVLGENWLAVFASPKYVHFFDQSKQDKFRTFLYRKIKFPIIKFMKSTGSHES